MIVPLLALSSADLCWHRFGQWMFLSNMFMHIILVITWQYLTVNYARSELSLIGAGVSVPRYTALTTYRVPTYL